MDGIDDGREEEVETPDPQSCSSSNRASMDGTGDGREEEAETPNPYTCSSSNRASMDNTGNEKSKSAHTWHTAPDEIQILPHQKSDATYTCFGFWLKEVRLLSCLVEGEKHLWSLPPLP